MTTEKHELKTMLNGESEPGVPLFVEGGDPGGRHCRDCGYRWYYKRCPRCNSTDVLWYTIPGVPHGSMGYVPPALTHPSEKRMESMIRDHMRETGMSMEEVLRDPHTSKKARRLILRILRLETHTY